MNCARWMLTLLLTVLITPMLFGISSEEDPPMMTPPPELQNFITLESGEVAIYFTEDQWIELSNLVWSAHVYFAEEAVKEAVVPLLAENEQLKKQARRWQLIGWGAVAVGAGALFLTALALVH